MRTPLWLTGQGMKARALRGTGMTVIATVGTNGLRLASNLVLARLLTPEIFGLMALANVFLIGLKMFSDTGVTTSIVRSPRGDEDIYLDTAWTLQIGRGVVIWLAACLLAWPAALIYDEPALMMILPVAALSVLIDGFSPTKVATANRHLLLGRVTWINLSTQFIQILITVAIAWVWPSVWALVIGGLIGIFITVGARFVALPGRGNWFAWEREAGRELITFGKFILLATGFSFLIDQSDRIILGAQISTAELGVYSIGYMFGSLPILLGVAVSGAIMMPLYRSNPIAGNAANRAKIFRARRIVTLGTLSCSFFLACAGVALIDLLYDSRYALAGPIIVLLNVCLVPRLIMLGSGAALLAAGDSRAHFTTMTSTALLQTGLMVLGVLWLGIPGVLLATFLAIFLVIPLQAYFLNRYESWDPKGDAILFSLGMVLNGLACWWHWADILRLF